MAEHGFTPGEWRAVAMGGASTVLCHYRPRHNNTAAPTYGYRENGDYCVATPFKDDGDLTRPDFVTFSHDDARLIAASKKLLEALEQAAADLRRAATLLAKHGEHDAAAQCDQREERARAAITLATGKDA